MAQIRFEIECPGAAQVYLAGNFNGWDPTARRITYDLYQGNGDGTFADQPITLLTEGQRRHHATRAGRSDRAASMPDIREQAARTAQRAGERIGDWPKDEPSGREFGQIGNH